MSTISEHQEYLLRTTLALGKINAKDYLSEPLPSPTDEMLMQMSEVYLNMVATEDRALFLTLFDERSSELLSIFAHRMSMLAVRRQLETLILQGLVMLALAVANVDWREATMTLSLLYNSGKRLGKAQELFTQAAAIAPTPFASNWLLDFVRRRPEDQRIEAMGFKEFDGPHGLLYQFGKQPIPDGWM